MRGDCTAFFLMETGKSPVLFRKSVIKYPMGVSFGARCKKEDDRYAADGI